MTETFCLLKTGIHVIKKTKSFAYCPKNKLSEVGNQPLSSMQVYASLQSPTRV